MRNAIRRTKLGNFLFRRTKLGNFLFRRTKLGNYSLDKESQEIPKRFKARIFSNVGSMILIALIICILILSLKIRIEGFRQINVSIQTIAEDFYYSFLRVTLISLFGWGLAIVLGAVLNRKSFLKSLMSPAINLLRHISPFAWFPFAIIWFGLGEYPIAFVLFITLFFPALVSVIEIFRDIPQEYLDEAKVCGVDIIQQFLYIEIPVCLTSLINLYRVLWGLGWTMVIAAEMLGTAKGLGYRLLDFRYLLYYEEMVVYIVFMGIVGVGIDFLLMKAVKSLR